MLSLQFQVPSHKIWFGFEGSSQMVGLNFSYLEKECFSQDMKTRFFQYPAGIWGDDPLNEVYLCCSLIQIVPQIQNIYLESLERRYKRRDWSGTKNRACPEIFASRIGIFRESFEWSLQMVHISDEERQGNQEMAFPSNADRPKENKTDYN